MRPLQSDIVEGQDVEDGTARGVAAASLQKGENRLFGQAALSQFSTTLPDWPERMASKPS